MKVLLSVLALLLFSFSTFAFEVGDVAKDFTLHQIAADDSESDVNILSTNSPNQFVLLEFATTWCPHCQTNNPLISQLAGEVSKTTTTRIIYVDTNENIRENIKTNRSVLQVPVAMDSESIAWDGGYADDGVPVTYIIDRDGKVLFKHLGSLNQNTILRIKSLLTSLP